MKKIIIALVAIVIIGLGFYFLNTNFFGSNSGQQAAVTDATSQEDDVVDTEEKNPKETIIGASVENRDIVAHYYGTGDTELLFVGGIHGGYEWNTVLVAYELMDYLEAKPEVIPENVRVTVIPVLNPDGLYKTVGSSERFTRADVPTTEEATISGRYNANEVDLNRNFSCNWQSTAVWRNQSVKAGGTAFSEPESQAIRDYVIANKPKAVVVWYSAADGVFASSCDGNVLSETSALTNLFASASGYPAYEKYDYYEITGDMTNWLADQGVPAISVLLSTHEDIEWDKNKAGVNALLGHYAN